MQESASQFTDTLVTLLATYGIKVVGAVLILVVGYVAARWAGAFTRKRIEAAPRIDSTLGVLFAKIVFLLVMAITLIAVLNNFGVQTASLVAVLGAAGLAVGLALQGTLSNVASGVMLLILRPFRNGDYIRLGGQIYAVDEVGLFVTRAHEPDGPKATIPNSQLWGQVIVNFSDTHNDQRRINDVFGISYADDIDKAIGIIHQVLDAEDRILDDPERLVEVSALNESSVDILVWAYTQRADWWVTKLELNRKIKQAFDANGITIPFPQRDVHMHSGAANA